MFRGVPSHFWRVLGSLEVAVPKQTLGDIYPQLDLQPQVAKYYIRCFAFGTRPAEPFPGDGRVGKPLGVLKDGTSVYPKFLTEHIPFKAGDKKYPIHKVFLDVF